MSEKAKVDKPRQGRVNKYGFLGLWVGSQVIGWLSFFLLSRAFSSFGWYITPDWLGGIIIGLAMGIPTAIGQKLALYLHFGRWFQGWVRANSIAWILGGLLLAFMSNWMTLDSRQSNILMQVMSLTFVPTLAQMWVLRTYVQKTWLWLLAAVAAASVFAGVFVQIGAGDRAAFPAFGLHSLVTGLSLLWMMGMQSDKRKVENIVTSRLEDGVTADVAEADDVELERLANRK